jgi:hypothetical protein
MMAQQYHALRNNTVPTMLMLTKQAAISDARGRVQGPVGGSGPRRPRAIGQRMQSHATPLLRTGDFVHLRMGGR